MYRIIRFFYTFLPQKMIVFLGKSKFLRSIRNFILRPNNVDVIIDDLIKWEKGKFYFFASIKVVHKAKTKGIENKLLKNTIYLLTKNEISEPVILDVGANYGFISLALQSNLSKKSTFYSFEPHPDIFSAFKKSIKKNNIKNITLENYAVGHREDNISINLYGQTSNILNTGNKVINTVEIKQIKLDSYLSERNIIPDFIKIDVDGYELMVLEGLKETIAKHKPILVVELNDDKKVLDFLLTFDYELLNLDLNSFSDLPNNIFCVKKN
ncbi:FkbM family methyltransferase [Flavobacterium piscinae]|uniref:FkbM family methyltransferase n=1 Tax=Flavobacterium piscinae TaxID=2506424 RepID=A0A4Q1KSI5_9FLAO|nr:FkbM family methyltransferase [Flavobacterium piscinae]RXR33068.1 FkbM family methyltransferase [Flavobacterium piscinae]